jgi:3-oxoacyl-[acyl-carrier-protein] synthase II
VSVPVAITGAAAVVPAGAPLEASVELHKLRERIARVERLSALALAAGVAVLADAGLALPARRERAGVVLGTAFGCLLTNADYQQRFAAGGVGAASPRLFAATVSNAAAGEIGIAFGLAGPGVTVSAGCASGTLAVGHAASLVAGGDANVLVAGGADAAGAALADLLAAGGLPVGASVTESAAFVTVEPLAAARARGARVRGMLLGHAAGFEPDPVGPDAGEALAGAIETAARAADVAAVASAVPPSVAALAERALARAFGARSVARLAFDGGVGHSLGASGPRLLLHVLETTAPGTTVAIADACPSGHVAALVVRVGDIE